MVQLTPADCANHSRPLELKLKGGGVETEKEKAEATSASKRILELKAK